MRNTQATLSAAPLSHSRRAHLGAHARRGRRSPGNAARDGAARRSHGADDHAQVSRGHGICRRGHDPAARPSRRRGTRPRPHARRHGRHDDRRAGADQVTRAQRDIRGATARRRPPERARRCRAAGVARGLADHQGGRDRRDRGGFRQRPAPARRGAGRAARGERRRESASPASATTPRARRCAATGCRACRKSRSRTRASPA